MKKIIKFSKILFGFLLSILCGSLLDRVFVNKIEISIGLYLFFIALFFMGIFIVVLWIYNDIQKYYPKTSYRQYTDMEDGYRAVMEKVRNARDSIYVYIPYVEQDSPPPHDLHETRGKLIQEIEDRLEVAVKKQNAFVYSRYFGVENEKINETLDYNQLNDCDNRQMVMHLVRCYKICRDSAFVRCSFFKVKNLGSISTITIDDKFMGRYHVRPNEHIERYEAMAIELSDNEDDLLLVATSMLMKTLGDYQHSRKMTPEEIERFCSQIYSDKDNNT